MWGYHSASGVAYIIFDVMLHESSDFGHLGFISCEVVGNLCFIFLVCLYLITLVDMNIVLCIF